MFVRLLISLILVATSASLQANEKILSTALKEFGVSNWAEPGRVIQYSKDCDLPFRDVNVPWCGIFMCHVFKKADLEDELPKVPQLARSWATVGKAVTEPEPGDIAIFWRNTQFGYQGHVGIFLRFTPDGEYIYLLGGNQGGQVSVIKMLADRLISFRRVEE